MGELLEKNIPEMKRVYYSMVSSIDDYLGDLMLKVTELGLDENTIIVFSLIMVKCSERMDVSSR